MKIILNSILPFVAASAIAVALAPNVVSAVDIQGCIDGFLEKRVACFDSDGPCDPLPIPEEAMAMAALGPSGYRKEIIRDTEMTRVYAVSDNVYNFLIVLDLPQSGSGTSSSSSDSSEEGRYVRRRNEAADSVVEMAAMARKGKSGKRGRGRMDSKTSVAIVDFPDFDFVAVAVQEILFSVEGLTASDIDVTYMVYTHNHKDHIGRATQSMEVLKSNNIEDIEVVAVDGVAEQFELLKKINFFQGTAPFPTKTVRGEMVLDVGQNTQLQLVAARGHAEDMIVFMPKEEETDSPAIMMFVDVVFPKWAPFFRLAISENVAAFIELHSVLLDEFDLGEDGVFVGGHLTQLGSRADIVASLDYTMTVVDEAAKALGEVGARFGEIAGASGVFDPNSNNLGNTWLLFGDFLGEVVRVCAKNATARLGCRFAGADVTIASACNVVQDFLRVGTV